MSDLDESRPPSAPIVDDNSEDALEEFSPYGTTPHRFDALPSSDNSNPGLDTSLAISVRNDTTHVQPQAAPENHDACSKIESSLSANGPPNGIAESWMDESTILGLSLATALDTFMEIKVPGWQKVMMNPNRIEHQWFCGKKLHRRKIISVVHAEIGVDAVSARKIHDHINVALEIIANQGCAEWPLKKGEMKAARKTLYGLFSAILKALDTDEKNYSRVMQSPQKLVAFLEPHLRWHQGLSAGALQELLNRHWE